ncbi:ankyrin repeat domain-containing protein 12-like [Copidosoma floridanum]|uniref:ankyrin repeat domain-containing protein 12-like n=1 Tax=Copidosoma floridanum TaxID=29053 RepID=UPI0006C983DA|nr:ankyrin repeat domain-containing protein 12-like [Copidosoma floridanum]
MININKWAKTCNSLRELLNLLSCSKCKKSLHEPRQFLDCGHVSCISCTNNSNNTCVDCLLNSKNQNLQKDETIHKIVQACCTIANIVGLKNNEDIGMKLEQAPLSHNGNIAISNPKLDNNILTIHNKFRAILCNPKKINKRSPKGETILLQECLKNHVDNVKAFLDVGADPNIPCFAGWTPLQECVDYNFYELSEILLKFNADVNKKGHEGRTALHEAARNNNSNFIQLLLSYGAKKNVFDDAGNLPVSYCQSEETKALLHVDKDENSPENRNLFEVSNEFPSISESTSQIIVSPLNNNNSLTEDKSVIATNTNESPKSSNKTPSTFKRITRSSPLSMCSTEKDESTNSKRHENIIEEYSGETLSIIKETMQSSFIPTNEKEDKLYLNPSIEEEENSSQELDIVFEKVNNIDPKKNLNTSSSVFCSDDSQESIIVISSQKSRALYDKKNVTNSLRNTENNTISLDSEEIIDVEN